MRTCRAVRYNPVMKLFPQHLRNRQHATVIRRRSYGLRGKGDYEGTNIDATPVAAPRMGTLGKVWVRGSGLTAKQAATGLPAAAQSVQTAVWGLPSLVGSLSLFISGVLLAKHGMVEPLAVSIAATAALSYLSAVPLARWAFHGCYKQPLAEAELEQLLDLENMATDLEKSYLRLVRDAVRQTADVSSETEAALQTAIESLCEAIIRHAGRHKRLAPRRSNTPRGRPAFHRPRYRRVH